MLLSEPNTTLADIEDQVGDSCGGCRFRTATGCRWMQAGCSECVLSKAGPSREITPDTAASSGGDHDHYELSSSGNAADFIDDDDEEEIELLSPTTTSCTGAQSHISMFANHDQTLILLDWDDTICPTTYIWSHPELKWDRPASPEELKSFQKHTLAAEALLRFATELGKVCIVTLAQEPWVSTSIAHFMPDLQGLFDELEIDVVYARSTLSEKALRGMIADELRDAGQALKTAAMRQVIDHGNWTSAISIGDSDAEFYSIQDVVFHGKQTEPCACKAVKLVGKPELETLTTEIEVLLRWLPSIVDHSGDLELDFEELGFQAPDSPTKSPSSF